MSRKNQPGTGRQERYIQASILLGLVSAPSYGYELISTIQTFGFIEGSAPPGMIYRHLRQMEEDKLVSSEWNTGGVRCGQADLHHHRRRERGAGVLDSLHAVKCGQAEQLHPDVQGKVGG